MQTFDVAIVGAGAAGLFCAGVAAQQGLQVLVIDHYEKVAEKVRISGGGRSNFTNIDIDVRAPHKHFLGQNPQFCRSAQPWDPTQPTLGQCRIEAIGRGVSCAIAQQPPKA